MNEEVEQSTTTAAEIVAALVDTMSLHDVPVTGRAKGMIGRQAKELLADGFTAETVLAASVIALRRGEPHVAHFIAQDIVLMLAGQKITRSDYEREMKAASMALNPAMQRIDAVLDELEERRRQR